ncbi:MAG: hypothetical protein ABIM98_02890 [candidate division WOR-3 bacterium]
MDILKIYNILKKIEEINPRFVIENIFEEKFEKLITLKEIDKKK